MSLLAGTFLPHYHQPLWEPKPLTRTQWREHVLDRMLGGVRKDQSSGAGKRAVVEQKEVVVAAVVVGSAGERQSPRSHNKERRRYPSPPPPAVESSHVLILPSFHDKRPVPLPDGVDLRSATTTSTTTSTKRVLSAPNPSTRYALMPPKTFNIPVKAPLEAGRILNPANASRDGRDGSALRADHPPLQQPQQQQPPPTVAVPQKTEQVEAGEARRTYVKPTPIRPTTALLPQGLIADSPVRNKVVVEAVVADTRASQRTNTVHMQNPPQPYTYKAKRTISFRPSTSAPQPKQRQQQELSLQHEPVYDRQHEPIYDRQPQKPQKPQQPVVPFAPHHPANQHYTLPPTNYAEYQERRRATDAAIWKYSNKWRVH